MPHWKVEFHCHTHASPDSLLRPSQLVDQARRIGLDRVVVTDHNTITGALEAQLLAPDLIIVGEEILTTKGELLAAFVREEVPRGLPPMEAVARLRAQNAFISVSHPYDLGRKGWLLPDLEQIIPYVDAIETFNSRSTQPRYNHQAEEFARLHDLAGTVGSDAHTGFELGRATMQLQPFTNADQLRAVIRAGTLETRLSSPFVHFTSFWARTRKQPR